MLEKGKELTQKRVHFSDDEDDGHEDNVDDDECSEAGDVEEDLGSSKDNFSKKRPLEDDGEGFEMKHSKKHKKQKTDESDVMLSTTFEVIKMLLLFVHTHLTLNISGSWRTGHGGGW